MSWLRCGRKPSCSRARPFLRRTVSSVKVWAVANCGVGGRGGSVEDIIETGGGWGTEVRRDSYTGGGGKVGRSVMRHSDARGAVGEEGVERVEDACTSLPAP